MNTRADPAADALAEARPAEQRPEIQQCSLATSQARLHSRGQGLPPVSMIKPASDAALPTSTSIAPFHRLCRLNWLIPSSRRKVVLEIIPTHLILCPLQIRTRRGPETPTKPEEDMSSYEEIIKTPVPRQPEAGAVQ